MPIYDVYFNQRCLPNNLIRNFAKINIPDTYPASKFTQHIASTTRKIFNSFLLIIYKLMQTRSLVLMHRNIYIINKKLFKMFLVVDVMCCVNLEAG